MPISGALSAGSRLESGAATAMATPNSRVSQLPEPLSTPSGLWKSVAHTADQPTKIDSDTAHWSNDSPSTCLPLNCGARARSTAPAATSAASVTDGRVGNQSECHRFRDSDPTL